MAKKEQIISHSRKLFEHFGFKKTGLADIAKSLGIVKSAIYYYFSGKEEIFCELVSIEANEFVDKMIIELNQPQHSSDPLRAYIDFRFSYLKDLSSRYHFLKSEFLELYPLIEKNREEALKREIEFVAQQIRQSDPELDIDSANQKAHLLVRLLIGFEIQVFVTESIPFETSEKIQLQDLLINGISEKKQQISKYI